jgi:hypothetical protein
MAKSAKSNSDKKSYRRKFSGKIEKELWVRAAGRCELKTCNRLLFVSSVTKAPINHAEMAHIWPFSDRGPRGGTGDKPSNVDGIDNLMLLCAACHKEIDDDKDGVRFSLDLLRRWKREHEDRIRRVTGIDPLNGSHVLIYCAGIDGDRLRINPNDANAALFSLDMFPADENPMIIQMTSEEKDSDSEYWRREDSDLVKAFERRVEDLFSRPEFTHLSVFARAPMPLMIRLGSLISDKINTQIYQLHREPVQTWAWPRSSDGKTKFSLVEPAGSQQQPVLILSLSAEISKDRIHAVLGHEVSIWVFRSEIPNPEIIKSPCDLSAFREAIRKAIIRIDQVHGKVPLSIFPAMPVSCAVEMGRIRFSKADMPWVIYDHNNKREGFIRALDIN